MNKIKKILPILILAMTFVGAAVFGTAKPMGVVHAQGSPPDQTSGFAGTLLFNPSNAVVISATTLSGSLGGPAVVAPPGFAAASARIHLKHIDGMATTSCTLGFYEHPTSGSNRFICNLNLAAATPNSVKAGNNEGLGLNGYLTAAGSSIVIVGSVNSNVTALNFVYSLE